jgi:hypothetical protein
LSNLVYEKINLVMADLSKIGIAKTGRNSQQGFDFRGIDQIYAALSPVLSAHGLMCIPRVLTRTSETRKTSKGNDIFYVFVSVEYDLVATDGSKHTACVFAEAMDSADKATNKAMSAAFKYMAMQVFCIPVEGQDDADSVSHDDTTAKPSESLLNSASASAAKGMVAFQAYWKGIMEDERNMLRENYLPGYKKQAADADKTAALAAQNANQ